MSHIARNRFIKKLYRPTTDNEKFNLLGEKAIDLFIEHDRIDQLPIVFNIADGGDNFKILCTWLLMTNLNITEVPQ